MIISYLRSSSYNAYDFCQMKYMLSYVLGYQDEANLAAEKGTVVHKVLEILALIKLDLQQDSPAGFIVDDVVGKYEYDLSKFNKEYLLSNKQIDFINKLRGHRNYMHKFYLEYGHIRHGHYIINQILEKVYKYYSSRSKHEWTFFDEQDCQQWLWITLEWDNGKYHPLNRDIYMPEQHFDIEIREPWAEFNYGDYKGYLGIKGTIDLITKLDDTTLEVCDWKTGRRKNWATMEEKTHKKLCADPQLMLYFYALNRIVDFQNIILTIFFIRDGGPYPITFDKSDLPEIEEMLKNRFLEIKNNTNPQPCDPNRKINKCQWCSFSKPNTNGISICENIENKIKTYGIDYVTKNHTMPGFSIGKYNAPGA